MKELIGTKINQIFVNEDQSLLKFVTDKGDIIYSAEGDCCSESWFAEILFNYGWTYGKFFGSVVEDVQEIEIPAFFRKMVSDDGKSRQEYDQVYGFKIISKHETNPFNNQECEIIFRNSSNGYYYGWCDFVENPSPYLQGLIEEAKWEEIKDDWTA